MTKGSPIILFIQFSGYDPEKQDVFLKQVGADGGEGTPVPIPNTAVKLTCADNTWLVAAREDRKAPTQQRNLDDFRQGFFVVPHLLRKCV